MVDALREKTVDVAADDELGEAYVAQADWDQGETRATCSSCSGRSGCRRRGSQRDRRPHAHARRPLAGLSPHPTGWRTAWPRPRTHSDAPALHPADSHDLIRVQGARENNLKDLSVELPKRRLTVFTGVSGSGQARWCSARSPRSRSG